MKRDHYDATTGSKSKERKCVDCPAMIPCFGGRKRCSECQHKNYVMMQNRRKNAKRANRRAAREATKAPTA